MPDPRLAESLRLFKEGQYFESHDVLEELWLETPAEDPYRDFYKGVIQAAAAFYQLKRGRTAGAMSLYRSSVKYLEGYAPLALGLDVSKFIGEMRRVFSAPPQG